MPLMPGDAAAQNHQQHRRKPDQGTADRSKQERVHETILLNRSRCARFAACPL